MRKNKTESKVTSITDSAIVSAQAIIDSVIPKHNIPRAIKALKDKEKILDDRIDLLGREQAVLLNRTAEVRRAIRTLEALLGEDGD